jgi:hypothetical protein
MEQLPREELERLVFFEQAREQAEADWTANPRDAQARFALVPPCAPLRCPSSRRHGGARIEHVVPRCCACFTRLAAAHPLATPRVPALALRPLPRPALAGAALWLRPRGIVLAGFALAPRARRCGVRAGRHARCKVETSDERAALTPGAPLSRRRSRAGAARCWSWRTSGRGRRPSTTSSWCARDTSCASPAVARPAAHAARIAPLLLAPTSAFACIRAPALASALIRRRLCRVGSEQV